MLKNLNKTAGNRKDYRFGYI